MVVCAVFVVGGKQSTAVAIDSVTNPFAYIAPLRAVMVK
jgi:hypothetical protein